MPKDLKVTRLEIIDHRPTGDESALWAPGRVFSAHNCVIELAYQDDGKTLKVFVGERKEKSNA